MVFLLGAERLLMNMIDTITEFFDDVDVGADDECWTWLGPYSSHGYPEWARNARAHRAMYQLEHGPIPGGRGTHVHHTCENKSCVNPAHLELLGHREHMRRHRQRQVYCQRGHLQVGENVYHRKDRPGKRQCRACIIERDREKRVLASTDAK